MIQVTNLSFAYEGEGKNTIEDINLDIKKGEFVVLAGRSGHGKTTITRVLNGLIPYYFEGKFEGELQIEGRKGLTLNQLSQDIASVFQDHRSQFFSLDVLSELAFTLENFGLKREVIDERINYAIDTIGIRELLDKSIFNLSSGQKQKLAIGSALSQKPKVIILDEPSSNLDYDSILRLAKILKTLKNEGYTIILSEHRLFYLKELIDTLYYIEEGRIKDIFTKEELINSNNLADIGLRAIDLKKKKYIDKEIYIGDSLIKLENISFAYKKREKILKDISFELNRGDIVALLGKNGSGKSTLAKVMAGLLKEKSGKIVIDNKIKKAKERIKDISLVLQDADYQLFSESVYSEFLLGNSDIQDKHIDKLLSLFDLNEFKDKHPLSLSGGQKQRLTIALSLLKESPLVILDEPTSGLDYDSMKKVVKFCRLLKKLGKVIVIITHDYEFINYVSNRIIHLKDGGVDEDFYLEEGKIKKLKRLFMEDEDEEQY